MRQVVLDTETTGLAADQGHRIIEIGCLEIVDRRLTGRTLHLYLDPEREVDEAATEVHGMTWEDLRDKPRFAEVADRVRDFVVDAEVLIHNAAFDLSFLDAEFARIGGAPFRSQVAGVVDTLLMARELHPGKRNSLDALCDRYGVSNAHRTLHGALLDAQLLAEVYLAMTRGQESFEIALETGPSGPGGAAAVAWPPSGLRVLEPSQAERDAHEAMLAAIGKECRGTAIWAATPQPAAG